MKNKIVFVVLASAVLVSPSCKKKGCIDPLANNYSVEAEKDNGKCDYSALEITEDITTNTTWSSGKAYLINSTINVSNNATLTIEPGTIIRFGESGELDVSYSGDFGTIKALGTADKPIVFTSNAQVKNAGDWDGIWLYNGANSCEFRYCTFEYGGGYSDYSGVLTNKGGDNVKVDYCTFKHSQYYGLYHAYGTFSSITNNNFSNTGLNNIRVKANEVHHIGVGNDFSTDILVYGGDIDSPGDVIWLNHGTGYSVDGSLNIGSSTGTQLVINPGCVLKFGENDEISIGYNTTGLINAVGTVVNPITFTSKSTYPTKGDWDGIWFYSNSANGSKLEFCTVSYGGGYNDDGNIIFKYGQGSKVTINNCIFSYSKGYGLFLSQTSDTSYPNMSNNTFSNNTLGDKNW